MTHSSTALTDRALLPELVDAVHAAGDVLHDRFTADGRPQDLDAILVALAANDEAVLVVLQPRLQALRPQAGWIDEELDGGALPSGEWWVTDPAEGNINHVHGMPDWAVTATLVRDNEPVATVVYLPLIQAMYTAVRGGGAHLNGVRLRTSGKTRLDAALVGTGQARPGESAQAFGRIGASVHASLGSALVTRVSVPATLQLIQVAAGRMDAFWQHSDVRSGLVAGALLVSEAGGIVTDIAGNPWTVASSDFLAATPGLHAATSAFLSETSR